MQTLTITKITLNPTPSGNTPCTVYYSLGSDPTNWILINNNVSVPPSGVLGSALVVNTIPDSETEVNVRAVANCGGTPYDEVMPGTTTTTAGTTTTTTAATTTTTTTAGTTTTTAATTTTTTAGTTTTTTTASTQKNVLLTNNLPVPIVLKYTINGVETDVSLNVGQTTSVTIADNVNSGFSIFEVGGTTPKEADVKNLTSEGPDVVFSTFSGVMSFSYLGQGANFGSINSIRLDPPIANFSINVTKDVANDEVHIVLVDNTTPYNYDLYVHAGTDHYTFVGILKPGHSYTVDVLVGPSGRSDAPMNMSQTGPGTLGSCSACTEITATSVSGGDGDIDIAIGI